MKINRLFVQNFRNHISAEFKFSEGVTLVEGPNGSGKSNLLEAIAFLSFGKSNRVILEKETINRKEKFARLVGYFDTNDKLEVALKKKDGSNRIQKFYKINGVKKTGSQFVGAAKVVQFSPEDIRLVAGSPSRRREYLDKLLSQISREYYTKLLRYGRVLKQRNKLLDQLRGQVLHPTHQSQLSFWSNQLVETGEVIHRERSDFFVFAGEHLKDISDPLFAHNYYLKLHYLESEASSQVLKAVRAKELATGVTQVGPHRDDFNFVVTNGHDMNLKNYGSRGQQRTGVLSIKALEIEYIKQKTGTRPILLLDDIFSELDDYYRKAVLSIVDSQQTIISTSDISSVPEQIKRKALILPLKEIQLE